MKQIETATKKSDSVDEYKIGEAIVIEIGIIESYYKDP